MEQSPGTVIEARRKEFSLNKLEKITGMNRSSILRYQRGDLPIPEEVAEKLANAFFKKTSERKKFLELCAQDAGLNRDEAKARRARRAARTLASKDCECVFRIFPEYRSNERDTVNYSELFFGINVFTHTQSGKRKKIFTVHVKGYEFWDWGEKFETGEPKRLVQEQALLHLISVSSRNWKGPYALIDLAMKTLKKQPDVQHLYGLDENQTILMSERSLDFMKEKISEIAVDEDKRRRKKTAEYLVADIESLKRWRGDVRKGKQKLHKQIQSIISLIDARLAHKAK